MVGCGKWKSGPMALLEKQGGRERRPPRQCFVSVASDALIILRRVCFLAEGWGCCAATLGFSQTRFFLSEMARQQWICWQPKFSCVCVCSAEDYDKRWLWKIRKQAARVIKRLALSTVDPCASYNRVTQRMTLFVFSSLPKSCRLVWCWMAMTYIPFFMAGRRRSRWHGIDVTPRPGAIFPEEIEFKDVELHNAPASFTL